MPYFRLKMHQIQFRLGLRWGAYSAPTVWGSAAPDPLAGGEGARCPSPRTTPPLSALRAFILVPLALAPSCPPLPCASNTTLHRPTMLVIQQLKTKWQRVSTNDLRLIARCQLADRRAWPHSTYRWIRQRRRHSGRYRRNINAKEDIITGKASEGDWVCAEQC